MDFLGAGCPSCYPAVAVKALKATQHWPWPVAWLHPGLDSLWKRHCCFYTGSLTPMPDKWAGE